MTDRSLFDSLKSDLISALATGPSEPSTRGGFPLTEALTALRQRRDQRGAAVVKWIGESANPLHGAILHLADALAAASTAGIRRLGSEGAGQPVEALVDLLGHAEAVRALWYDLFLGIRRAEATSERSDLVVALEASGLQLVAEAGLCAGLFGVDSGQLAEFARESGLAGKRQ